MNWIFANGWQIKAGRKKFKTIVYIDCKESSEKLITVILMNNITVTDATIYYPFLITMVKMS